MNVVFVSVCQTSPTLGVAVHSGKFNGLSAGRLR